MNSERVENLVRVYRDGLLEDVIPFWTEHCVDRQHGGFMMALDRDGSVVDTDKSVWQQCRFTWLLGELYNNVQQRDQWLELARHGIEFIDRHCFDPRDGRMWFHVTREGIPIRKRRYAFSESFAAIAYGEYAKATDSAAYAEKAKQAFHEFVNHNLEPKGVQPKFTEHRPMKGIGFPMICLVTAQQLRESIGFDEAANWIDRSIETIRIHHIKHDIRCVMENVGPNGEIIDHFDGRLLNPGHAIEAAWFIMDEGRIRGDESLVKTGCQMLDWMWQRGWDQQFGGMLYFTDVHQLPVQEYWHDMKFWWPQNETIIASLLAYELTGEERYAQMHRQVHDWTYRHFPDSEHGEWFGYLRRDGAVSSPLKGNLWKGPFHMPRMKLVCWQILERMQSKARTSGGSS